jgi:hypothetical protein
MVISASSGRGSTITASWNTSVFKPFMKDVPFGSLPGIAEAWINSNEVSKSHRFANETRTFM